MAKKIAAKQVEGLTELVNEFNVRKSGYFYDLDNTNYSKLFSVRDTCSVHQLLYSMDEIAFAYIDNSKGYQENKTDTSFQLYTLPGIADESLYNYQKLKQDNKVGFNLLLGTKDISISAPTTSYRRYGFYIENSLKNDTSTNNKYYTISMLITPNASDTQDTKFFSSIVIEKAWKIRINFNAFKKVVNEDGTILLYSTFLLKKQSGEVFTEFGIICEGSTTNSTQVSNLKVEEGQTYTPYVKAFSELSADANGINFSLKGIPGSLPLSIGGKYIHIVYADDALGTGLSNSYEGKIYIGVYADENEAPSTQSSKYKWTLISSITNDIPCYVGDETYYLHFIYSSDGFGSSVSNTFGNPYIGYLLDKNLSNKEFIVYAKTTKDTQKLELFILAIDDEITLYDEVKEGLDSPIAFELIDSVTSLDDSVGDTDPLLIYTNSSTGK